METSIPSQVLGAWDEARLKLSTRATRLRVRVGPREHAVTEISGKGFVIAADGRPPLRGYADIFQGEERILHGLVMCSWAEDGLVGYEFKRSTRGTEVSPDTAPTAHAGLLDGPEG